MVNFIIAAILVIFFFSFVFIKTRDVVKSPAKEFNQKSFFLRQGLTSAAFSLSFAAMMVSAYTWANIQPKAYQWVCCILGSIVFAFSLIYFINIFYLHYYSKKLSSNLDKKLYWGMIASFVLVFVGLFVTLNGYAEYFTYPLVNGISFSEGFVTYEESSNIAFYALCILLGALVSYFTVDHFMFKEYGQHGLIESTFLVAFPAGIIGARIWYVIGNWSIEFADRPFWHVFAIWEGGLTILGGAVMGIIAGVLWIVLVKKKYNVWIIFDLALPSILLAQGIGRWGNFFNCEVHGVVTAIDNFKWLPEIIWRNAQYSSTQGFAGEGMMYVPLFFIEALVNVLGYFVLSKLFGRVLRKYLELGDVGFGYIIWYGLTRVFMEPLRDGSFNMGANGYWSWLWSLIFVFAGALLIVGNHYIRNMLRVKKNEYVIKKDDQKVGLYQSGVALLISLVFLIPAIIMMSSSSFETTIKFNQFNIGVILLVLGISMLAFVAIPLFKCFKAKANKQN